jgi:hypothetical protein
MIKECLVTLENGVVTVVRYGDTLVQLPSVHAKTETIFVEYKDGKYAVVDGAGSIDEDAVAEVNSEQESVEIEQPDKTVVKPTEKKSKRNNK